MYSLTKYQSFFLTGLFFMQFTACHLFESTKVSNQEIAKASKWSANDIGPSFNACDGLEGSEATTCFKNTISTSISEYLFDNLSVANQTTEEELFLLLRVDEEGFISLDKVDLSNALRDAIPDLEQILTDAILQLPQAIPAIKSNVGTYVSTEFQLPVRIIAQESK
jgi:hypothetical protein